MMRTVVDRRRGLIVAAVASLLVLVAWVGVADRVSAATSRFQDVPDGSDFGADIDWLADAGVTLGCDPAGTLFCPDQNVTRGQMAAFMHRLSGGDDRTLDGRLDALESGGGVPSDDLATLEAAVAALTTRLDALESEVGTLESKVGTLESENSALKATLAGVTRNGDTLLFEGMNLQVVNGLDSTRTSNGLGNVIIGYNEDESPVEDRTGSHYLVLGEENTYTKFGGIIAGVDNTASGAHASVLGGRLNTVTGYVASVSGGLGNTASNDSASVSGGSWNTASGNHASVSGGIANTASGDNASVTGGNGSTASGGDASVSGGYGNTASAYYASVSGGYGNTASSSYASVTGGGGNTASDSYASVTGGRANTASGYYASLTGGRGNTASGSYASVTGGDGNEVVGDYDTVVGGDDVTNISWPGAIAIGEGFWNGSD